MDTSSMTNIAIPFVDAAERHLRIGVGACRLKLKPGDGDLWVFGTYHDPSGSLPCRVAQEGGTARITQSADLSGRLSWPSGLPTFDLALGKGKPYALTIETGASDNFLDLGGLPIISLTIKQGAGKIVVDFSAPNPETMSSLSLGAGAGALEARCLGNANAAEMSVEGGAAAFKLDFGGTPQRDAHVKISTGMSSVEIDAPGTTAVKVKSEALLGNLEVGDGFMKKEGAFWNEAALLARGPMFNIHASVALGSVRLRLAP